MPTIDYYSGTPVIHFTALVSPDHEKDGLDAVSRAYRKALNIASDFGGKKFHNKRYGGGIAFHDVQDIEKCLESLKN